MRHNIFLFITCLCGALAVQAEPVTFGENLQWELSNDTLYITSPDMEQEARLTTAGTRWDASSASSVVAVEFPVNLTYIGANAFYEFTSLQEITLPASVNQIESFAFYGCANLRDVRCLPTTPPTLSANDVFSACHEDLTICVPEQSLALYRNMHNNWGQLYGDIIIACSEASTGINDVLSDGVQGTKELHSGQMIIIHGGECYDITGKKLNK